MNLMLGWIHLSLELLLLGLGIMGRLSIVLGFRMKLIPGSDGDKHKSTTLFLWKEMLWMWVAVTGPRHQPRPRLCVSGGTQSTAVESTVGGNANWCSHHGEQCLEVHQKTKNRAAR